MKIRFEKFEKTFIVGVSFAIGADSTSLIFDLGIFSLAFIFRKKAQ